VAGENRRVLAPPLHPARRAFPVWSRAVWRLPMRPYALVYILLVATVAAVIVLKLNPAIISAVAIPFVTLATATIARRRGKRDGD
jgi:hypothetical protein